MMSGIVLTELPFLNTGQGIIVVVSQFLFLVKLVDASVLLFVGFEIGFLTESIIGVTIVHKSLILIVVCLWDVAMACGRSDFVVILSLN